MSPYYLKVDYWWHLQLMGHLKMYMDKKNLIVHPFHNVLWTLVKCSLMLKCTCKFWKLERKSKNLRERKCKFFYIDYEELLFVFPFEGEWYDKSKFKCHSPTSKPMDNYIQFLSFYCMATYHSLTHPPPPPPP